MLAEVRSARADDLIRSRMINLLLISRCELLDNGVAWLAGRPECMRSTPDTRTCTLFDRINYFLCSFGRAVHLFVLEWIFLKNRRSVPLIGAFRYRLRLSIIHARVGSFERLWKKFAERGTCILLFIISRCVYFIMKRFRCLCWLVRIASVLLFVLLGVGGWYRNVYSKFVDSRE